MKNDNILLNKKKKMKNIFIYIQVFIWVKLIRLYI